MRISDDRYSRDRLRLDLALRFMRHEARTHTIRKWTGLTDDRIRKLYRSYLTDLPSQVARHRGKSPGQAAFFTRTPRAQQEAAVLASLYCLLGVMPCDVAVDAEHPLPGVARGERLCQAFEAYLMLVPSSHITFEHAVLLVNELARGDELKLGDCTECGVLVVVDSLALGDIRCSRCAEPGHCAVRIPRIFAGFHRLGPRSPPTQFFRGAVSRPSRRGARGGGLAQRLRARTRPRSMSWPRHPQLMFAEPEPRIAFVSGAIR